MTGHFGIIRSIYTPCVRYGLFLLGFELASGGLGSLYLIDLSKLDTLLSPALGSVTMYLGSILDISNINSSKLHYNLFGYSMETCDSKDEVVAACA